jgi:hypothetical protein
MRAPSRELRQNVAEQARALRDLNDEEAESGLENLLHQIFESLQGIIDDNGYFTNVERADDIVVSCHGWASLVSHAIAEVYAPNSPFPRRVAGWAQGVINRLDRISATLRKPLDRAKSAAGANSYSISVGFPWGISISFTW